MKKVRLWLRSLIVIAGLIALLLPGTGAFALPVDRATSVNSTQSAISTGKILVIAPHPDDDIIAAAGVIYRAVNRGDLCKVVFMTNGDLNGGAGLPGFGLAVKDVFPE